MIWGNAKWKQRPREEQAEIDGSEEVEKVATLLGIDSAELIKGLLKPRIKALHFSHIVLKIALIFCIYMLKLFDELCFFTDTPVCPRRINFINLNI